MKPYGFKLSAVGQLFSGESLYRRPLYTGHKIPPPAAVSDQFVTRIRESEQAVLDAIGKDLGYEGWEDLLVRWNRG